MHPDTERRIVLAARSPHASLAGLARAYNVSTRHILRVLKKYDAHVSPGWKRREKKSG